MTIFPAPTAMKWNAENFPSPFIPLLGLEESHFMDRKAISWMTTERLEKCEEWQKTIQVNMQAESWRREKCQCFPRVGGRKMCFAG